MTNQFITVTEHDVEHLLPIENACQSHPWNEKLFKSCISGHYFAEYLRANDAGIIGFYVAQCVAGEATLMDICVHPDQQGNGFGSSLLARFFEQAKVRNAEQLFLEVRASNIAAQMLYINNGFSEISRRTGYYPSAKGFGYEDAVVMKKMM
ncbi:MAG: ribosomal protein S18-alanine N-acetyltransferase [Thalassotalea sp.]